MASLPPHRSDSSFLQIVLGIPCHYAPNLIFDLEFHILTSTAKGDEVRSSTWRRVQSESTTGSVDSKRIKLSVTIRVEKVDFDPADGQLHLSVFFFPYFYKILPGSDVSLVGNVSVGCL